MFLIDNLKNRVTRIQQHRFSDLGIKERENLQEWIAHNPEFFGEELLIIQKEFDGFDDTRERLDLLALDKFGDIVIIENKLDDSGRDVTWQVLKYASYCASLSKMQIRDIYQKYLDKCCIEENAESRLCDFFEANDFAEVEMNKSQRIILVSGNFRKEVTSTVLWLLNNYKMKIQCFKIMPFRLDDKLFLNLEQIIPVKEVEEYTIRMAEKKQEDADTQEELKSRHKIRIAFWKQVLSKINNSETSLFQNVSPSKDNWITAGIGMSGVGLSCVVSRSNARTELYISRGDEGENNLIYEQLIAQKEQIESAFEGELMWEKMEGRKTCRIKNELLQVNVYHEEDWEKMIDFLIDSMVRMEKAFRRPLSIINQRIKRGIAG